jgi:putative NADH-flavin reductase
MRIAVVGATGRTGMQVVKEGLLRGHVVTAVARRPEAITLRHDKLVIGTADVLDPHALAEALTGAEAVVSTLGIGTSRKPTVLYSQGIANVLKAMAAGSISKLAVISAAPVGPRAGHPFIERHVVMPVLERLFGATYNDMRGMEALLRASDVDWVSLRPPRLLDRPATGRYRLAADGPLPNARTLTYADLASALLDALDREDLYRRAVLVAN